MDANSRMPADVNFGPSLLIACWTLATVAILIVVLRLVTRVKTAGHLSDDDYLMTVSLISGLACTILVTIAVSWGLGRHLVYLDPEQKLQAVKFDFIEQPFIVLSPCFGRISFALFLVQILRKNIRRRRFLYVIIACQLVVNISTTIVILAQCRPLKALWDPAIRGNCWSPKVQEYWSYFQGSWNALTDLILVIFPASFLWDLQLPLRKRLGLILIMGLGLFAMIASIIKTIQLSSLAVTADYTYPTAVLILWATIELYFVIIAASVPLIVPAYRWIEIKLQGGRDTVKSWIVYNGVKRGSTAENGDVSHLVPDSYTKVVGKKTPEEEYPLPTYPDSRIMKSTNVRVEHHTPRGMHGTANEADSRHNDDGFFFSSRAIDPGNNV